MVKEFMQWYKKWDEISSAPVSDSNYDEEWENTTPFAFISERIDTRGPTRDLEKAHAAIISAIQETGLKPNSILFTSEGERKLIEKTISEYRELADEIRQELFSRSMAITIHEGLRLNKLIEGTANTHSITDFIDAYK